jgi:hypothetical protein
MAARLGFYSAVGLAITFVAFTTLFLAIAASAPLFVWTNLADYVEYVTAYSQLFAHLARLAMLLFAPLLVILLNCIHEYAAPERKILSRTAAQFGLACAVLIGVNYFVQLTAVRLSLEKGEFAGLEHFLQGNPYSTISAVNMLGWTLFFGLASLFVAPVFVGGRLEKTIRGAFLVNGIVCLLAGVGYILEIPVLVFVTINLGMGAAVLVATVALSLLFRRKLAPPS